MGNGPVRYHARGKTVNDAKGTLDGLPHHRLVFMNTYGRRGYSAVRETLGPPETKVTACPPNHDKYWTNHEASQMLTS